MMKRILVVDDSAFMRKIISEQINKLPGFEVVATARDGETSFWKIEKFKPDAITLDVEMPGINGLEILKKIKKKWDIPVFMLSSSQEKDITIASLEAGAIDFIEKPKNLRENHEKFQEELVGHLKVLNQNSHKQTVRPHPNQPKNLPNTSRKAIVIGASTGGPRALMEVIGSIPSDLTLPIFIVQHMPKGFTTSFAERLNRQTKRPVVEAEHGEKIKAGSIYLAPGDYHMTIENNSIQLSQTDKVNGVRPAADLLFESASKKYGPDLLSIILTGMGKDGTYGMQKVKETNGYTIAQDKASSVVYGMPGNAVSAGVVDRSANLNEIGKILNEVCKVSK